MASLVVPSVALLIQPDLSVLAQQTLLPQGAKSPQQAQAENRSVQPAPPVSPQSSIKFEDAIDRSGIKFQLRNSVSPQKYYFETMLGGVAVFDYNNDGLPDIFFTNGAAIPSLEKSDPRLYNRLYRNNGDGTFTDVTEKAGVKGVGYSMGVAAGDYDNDGFVDLYVVGVNSNQLLHNNGDGTFSDVSKESGVSALHNSYGFTTVAFDIDEDGWQDIFVACDATPSLLLMNNHDGTFREEALLRGVALGSAGEPMGGMGVGIGDFDLDGHIDLLKTHFVNQATGLYRNNGKGEFDDYTFRAGLGGERRFSSWGTGLVDLDNDGYPDIFIVAGTVAPELERVYNKYPARNPRLVFRNQGNGTFVELGDEAGPAIASRHVSRGCAFGDFDNDGDLDILIMNRNEPPTLLRNDAPPGNHWIKVRLEGTKSNRSAIGSRVLVRYGGKVQAQCLTSQSSFLSANDPRLHFGLGAVSKVSVEVHWPAGTTETFADLSADQLITIREGQGIVKGRPFR